MLLFLIIFFWTPPHFWALALLRKKDYARAGVPMLPVVAGEDETRRQILIYAFVTAVAGFTPALFGFAGLIYGALAAVLGLLFIAIAADAWRKRRGVAAQMAARRLFAFSVLLL